MASFKFYLLSALIGGVIILGQAAVPTLPPTSIIDLKTTTEATTSPPDTTSRPDTTTPPATTSTTESTTTSTTPPTTTSTTPPTTSTTPPTTTSTTTPPTTTSTTTTTTTAVPPTTPPTPPAPPKPIGPPQTGLWAYTDSKNVTCVIVQFAAQLNVTYPKPNSSNSELYHVLVNVPANASVMDSGNCEGAEQWLTLSWAGSVNKSNTLTVLFAKNDTTKSYEMKSLNATLVASMFPNFTNVDSVDLYHGVEWQTPLASSYRCAAPTELKMTTDQANFAAMLTLSQLQEEAFRAQHGNRFSAARDCAGGDIPDAVPIAVGCALGGMVLVVLIAYLVARRRSAARGYLSM